jgi:hypothetical protein
LKALSRWVSSAIADSAAHFAEFATLVRLNSPPVSRVFAAYSEAALAADAGRQFIP